MLTYCLYQRVPLTVVQRGEMWILSPVNIITWHWHVNLPLIQLNGVLCEVLKLRGYPNEWWCTQDCQVVVSSTKPKWIYEILEWHFERNSKDGNFPFKVCFNRKVGQETSDWFVFWHKILMPSKSQKQMWAYVSFFIFSYLLRCR